MPITNIVLPCFNFIHTRVHKKPVTARTACPDYVDQNHTIEAMKMKMEEMFKTDSGEPPNKDVPKTQTGNYCFRAQTTLKDDKNTLRDYTGYDDNIDIVQKVERYCSTDESVYNAKCTLARLTFVQDVENCDGHVDIKDWNTNTLFQTF